MHTVQSPLTISNPHTSAKLFAILIGLLLLAMCPSVAAPRNVTDDDVTQWITDLKNDKTLSEQITSTKDTISEKKVLSSRLQKKLSIAQQMTSDVDRRTAVSLLTFELFLAEARISAEQIKLATLENKQQLQRDLNSPDLKEEVAVAIQNYLTALAESAARLQARSKVLAPFITDPNIKSQFSLFISRITAAP